MLMLRGGIQVHTAHGEGRGLSACYQLIWKENAERGMSVTDTEQPVPDGTLLWVPLPRWLFKK